MAEKVLVIDAEGNERLCQPVDAREIVAAGGKYPGGKVSPEEQAKLNEKLSKTKGELAKELVDKGAAKIDDANKLTKEALAEKALNLDEQTAENDANGGEDLKKLTKAELVTRATQKGIEVVPDEETKASIVAKILAAGE